MNTRLLVIPFLLSRSIIAACLLLAGSAALFAANAANSANVAPEPDSPAASAPQAGSATVEPTQKPPSKEALRELNLRGGMPHFFAKLARGEKVSIEYYGYASSQSSAWHPKIIEGLQTLFPAAKITLLNMPAPNSVMGVFRADADIVEKKPDLLFIENSIRDISDALTQPDNVAGALEGVVRKLWRSKPDADICFIYSVCEKDIPALKTGKLSLAASLQDRVAGCYGIPSLNMGVEVLKQIEEKKLVFKAPAAPEGKTPDGQLIFSNDGMLPTPAGGALYAATLVRACEQLQTNKDAAPRTIPEPISALQWETAKTVTADGNVEFHGTWEKLNAETGPVCANSGKKIYDWFHYLYRTATPGSSFTVTFKGTCIGFKGMCGPDSGVVGVNVDGHEAWKKNMFTPYCFKPVYEGIPLPPLPMGEHKVTWTLLDEAPPKEAMLAQKHQETDFHEHPEKYQTNAFSAGQILLLGEVLPPGL